MEAEKQERQAMLDESKTYTGREICRWAAHECLYHTLALGLIKQGVPLSRAGYLSMVGIPLMTPVAAVELLLAGLPVIGFQGMVPSGHNGRPRG